MANFVINTEATVAFLLRFPAVSEGTMQLFDCVNGERAGFRILSLNGFYVSQVYDYSTGDGVLLGTVSVLPETDLCGGMFSSGCFCDADPLSSEANFYRVDY